MTTLIGIEFTDPTKFEASRLIYWLYVFTFADKLMLSVYGLIEAINAQYGNWRYTTKRPQISEN